MPNDLIPHEPYQPQPPQFSKPRWGVIFLTGIIGALVVILGGFLVMQLGREINETATQASATSTPLPVIDSSPALAVRIPPQVQWRSIIALSSNGDTEIFDEVSGVRALYHLALNPPPADSEIRVRFSGEVQYIAPNLISGDVLSLPAQALGSQYINIHNILINRYYAAYTQNNQFLQIMDEEQVAALGDSVRVAKWQPLTDDMPTITPN